MTVDQQGVRDVLADDTGLIDVNIIDVVNEVDATALTSVCRLDDPHILLGLVLLELLVMIVEVTELVWQDIGVGGEIEGRLTVSLLHTDDVEAETVLAGDFVTLGEMVDLLVLVETLILVGFEAGGTP